MHWSQLLGGAASDFEKYLTGDVIDCWSFLLQMRHKLSHIDKRLRPLFLYSTDWTYIESGDITKIKRVAERLYAKGEVSVTT